MQTTKVLDHSFRKLLRDSRVEDGDDASSKKHIDSYRIHGEGNTRPIVATTESMKLICDAFLVPVQEQYSTTSNVIVQDKGGVLVFPVHYGLEELFAA